LMRIPTWIHLIFYINLKPVSVRVVEYNFVIENKKKGKGAGTDLGTRRRIINLLTRIREWLVTGKDEQCRDWPAWAHSKEK